ncbi:MAG: single-stranded-DNA-specific exonuclease RecJ [Desulfobulbus propionicus]|nr:MAG: single-stranded-DNA-specific exonuclease RecJ [Desulfobulbus propionicus]
MKYCLVHSATHVNLELKQALIRSLHLPAPLAHILCQRGFESVEQVRTFLFPQLSELPSPFLLSGMDTAVALIIDAFKKKETVYVHGDYDVDGISATVLLVQFFQTMGMSVEWHVPNRLQEKYGLSPLSIEKLCQGKQGLIITVDCGISNNDAVQFARKKGLKVIITDHHEPPAELPEAEAIVNPKISHSLFPYRYLSGVGVAFFLLIALRSKLVQHKFWERAAAPNLKRYLDLVALGTIADVMPLTEVNRTLVRNGLSVLGERVRPGILALCENAGLWSSFMSSEDVSYRLAPRLNAPGRMGQPELSVKLLLERSLEKARGLAAAIEKVNEQRKKLEANVLPTIYQQCEEQVQQGNRLLMVYSGECHPGIIGIAASRVVDVYARPVVILTDDSTCREGQILKGSGRSLNGINLHQLLCAVPEDLILQHGGHAMAVGLTVNHENLAKLNKILNDIIKEHESEDSQKTVRIDYQINNEELSCDDLVGALQYMQPFGEGNPEPVFMLKQEQLLNGKAIKRHLKFQVQHKKRHINGIGFGMSQRLDILSTPVDLIFKLRRTSFRGVERDEVQALHIQESA